MKSNKIVKNTIALYANNIAKMIIPLITLPYLTRVLSKDCYGTVAYVKAVMQYMQLIVDFGFLLSGTKDIVKARTDKEKMQREAGDIFAARIILACVAGAVLFLLIAFIPLLRKNTLYTLLSFFVVFLTCFLFDFLFRGIEEMQVIAIRFVTMKSIAAVLTFVFVKNDSDILWIPVLDIIGSMVAIALVFSELRKREIRIKISNLNNIIRKIKESAVYFASEVATTAFSALNTLLIGIYIAEAEVADWSLCMQLVAAVQSMYTPLTNSIYPEMVRSKNINLVKRILKIFMPVVVCGCIFTLIVAKQVLFIIGGVQYINAAPLLRCLVPVLFLSFPAMVFGWPTLGAIGKAKETTKTTVITATIQIIGLIILILFHHFTLINIAILRGLTEFVLLSTRYSYYRKFRSEYNEFAI